MADAGTSVDAGHEKQESEHGELFEASLGLEGLIPFPCFLIQSYILSSPSQFCKRLDPAAGPSNDLDLSNPRNEYDDAPLFAVRSIFLSFPWSCISELVEPVVTLPSSSSRLGSSILFPCSVILPIPDCLACYRISFFAGGLCRVSIR